MKAQKTPRQLRIIQANAILLMGGQIGDRVVEALIPEQLQDSKPFIHFRQFINKTVQKPLDKIAEQKADIELEHALEQNGKLVRNDAGGYEYSKEGRKALIADLRKLEDTPVEVHFDRESMNWNDLIALAPERSRHLWALSLNEDLKEALDGFYHEEGEEEA